MPGGDVASRFMAAEYRFLDRWVVPHEIERVFAAVGEPLAYPEWWSDVFLAATGELLRRRAPPLRLIRRSPREATGTGA